MQQKTKFARIIDAISLFLTIFLLAYFIFDKLIKNTTISIYLSIFMSIVIFISLIREINKKRGKLTLTQKEYKQKNEVMQALKFGNPTKIKQFVLHAFSKKHKVVNYKNYIELSINDDNFIIVYDFSSSELSHFNLITLTKPHLNKNKKIIVIAKNFSEDAIIYSKNSNLINLIDGNNFFMFLKEVNTFPILPPIENEQPSWLLKIKNNINRKNTFKFLRFGLLLVFLGHILPFSTYYKTFGIILIVLSIFALFIKIKQTSQNSFFQP